MEVFQKLKKEEILLNIVQKWIHLLKLKEILIPLNKDLWTYQFHKELVYLEIQNCYNKLIREDFQKCNNIKSINKNYNKDYGNQLGSRKM